MTKGLEDALNLPSIKEALEAMKEDNLDSDITVDTLQSNLQNIKQMKKDLGSFDFNDNETKLDQITELAYTAHKDLLDSGFNSPPTTASQYFEPAMGALNIMLNAETLKIERKLKLMKLYQEDRRTAVMERRMDLEEKKHLGNTVEETVVENTGQGIVGTRSSILKDLYSLINDK